MIQYSKSKHKKKGMDILISYKLDFKTRSNRDKERYLILKRSIQQEDKTIKDSVYLMKQEMRELKK